jgi:hypothetical protein
VASAYIRLALERPQSLKIFANPPEHTEAIERVAALANDQHRLLADVLREGVETGEINPSLDPDVTATALWGMLNGLLMIALRQDAMRPASVTAEALVETGSPSLPANFVSGAGSAARTPPRWLRTCPARRARAGPPARRTRRPARRTASPGR